MIFEIKNVILLLLFLAIIGLGAKIYNTPFSKCDTPIEYRIDSIDPKFGLKKEDVQKDAKEAINILNDSYENILFSYSDNAELKVNFVYDYRTALEEDITKKQNIIDLQNLSLQDRIKQYELDLKDFESRLSEYNQTVQSYNDSGGAPVDVYDQLEQKRQKLQVEGNMLNDRAKKLNLETSNYNLKVDDLNKNVGQFNTAITQRPEEGLYDGNTNTINIYFVDNKPELIHTLAHEFGHALGMIHVEDTNAIMYPSTSKTLKMTSQDKEQLNQVCESYPLGVHWINLMLIKMNSLMQPGVKLSN